MSKNNENLNILNIQFTNISRSEKELNANFIGLSENYKNSFVNGILNINLLDEDNTYNYNIDFFVNTIYFKQSGLIKKELNDNLYGISLYKSWSAIFEDGGKTSIGINTLSNDGKEENQYLCHANTDLSDTNNYKLYLFIQNYIWPHELITNVDIESPTSAPTVAPTSAPTAAPTSAPTASPTTDLDYECLENVIDFNQLISKLNSSDNKKYSLNIGYYKIINVPEAYPISLLHDNTGKIGYVGNDKNILFKEFNNLSYPYYWGEIDVVVAKNFEKVQIDFYYFEQFNPAYSLYFNSECGTSTLTPEPISPPTTPEPTSTPVPISGPINGTPSQIVGKAYYTEIDDFINQIKYISEIKFSESEISIIFYTDSSLTTNIRVEKHPSTDLVYNPESRLLILDVTKRFIPYILPAQEQGKFSRKIESMVFNEDFTLMSNNSTYLGLSESEINAFKPYLLSNGWIVNMDELYLTTSDKLYSIEVPNISPTQAPTSEPSTPTPSNAEVEIIKNFIPNELNEIAFYNWAYNVGESTPGNDIYYLNTFVFYADKIIELDYINNELSDYKNYYEYKIGDNFLYNKTENKLSVEISYSEPQYLIPNNNQGMYTLKVYTFEFKNNGNMRRTISYKNMNAAELNIYKPILETNNFIINFDEGNSSVISPGANYKRNIPEFPGEVEYELQKDTIQCLNRGLINSVSIRPSQSQDVYLFNNVPYSLNQYLGVTKGVYTLANVPKQHPIGFVINDLSKFEVIEGDQEDVKIVDGYFIMHYTGRVRFEVLGDFGTISYHCFNHGYMGGKNRLKYTEKC